MICDEQMHPNRKAERMDGNAHLLGVTDLCNALTSVLIDQKDIFILKAPICGASKSEFGKALC